MSTHSQHQRLAAWIFGSISFLVLFRIVFGMPDQLQPHEYNVLGILCGILCGLFGYFFTGTMKFTKRVNLSKWRKVGIQAAARTTLFVFVLLSWSSDASPIKVKHIEIISEPLENVQDSQANIQTILVKLEQELGIKNAQIEFLQEHINRLEKRTPSAKAKELAAKIPPNVNEYALTLKAIAEERYDDARALLDTATEKKEAELLYSLGRYKEAEPLCRRILETSERVLGSEHYGTLLSMNNLALLFEATGRYEKAEPLCRRVLETSERVLGLEHPDTLVSMNNLAKLLRVTGRYEEAESLYRRVLETRVNAYWDRSILKRWLL